MNETERVCEEEGEIKYKGRDKKSKKYKSRSRSRSRSRHRNKSRSKSYDKYYDRKKRDRDKRIDRERSRDRYRDRDRDRDRDRKKYKKRSKSKSISKHKEHAHDKIFTKDKKELNKIITNASTIPQNGITNDNEIIISENVENKDYDKMREERQKRLEEIKRKSEQQPHIDNVQNVQPLSKEINTGNTGILHMSNEDRTKLLKMVEEQREKNLQQELKLIHEQVQLSNQDEEKLLGTSALNDGGDKSPDMFAETPVDNLIPDNQKILHLPNLEEDSTGYYTPKLNEMLNNKYKVTGICGKGIFSNVVKVVDINNNKEYAVKIIRAIDVMIISGEKEKSILKKLNEIDKNDRSNIVRLIDSFELKRHLCMVYDLYEMNLRDLLKSRGTGVGLPLHSVRSFAQQLLFAFDLIHKYKIIHADFKPDNTLVNKSLDRVRLCDFGSALQVDEAVITSELVSRFYRAPELFLGCPYDTKIDIWSLGCTLYELYTGKILFPGHNNNEMVKLIMMTKGKIPQKVLKRGQYTNLYFNEAGDFLSLEMDPYNKKEYIKEINVNNYPIKDLMTLLKSNITAKLSTSEENNLLIFRDFLEKCLHLDAHKRFNTLEALTHEFIGIMPVTK